MSRERKTVAGPEKLAILRRYLAEKLRIARFRTRLTILRLRRSAPSLESL